MSDIGPCGWIYMPEEVAAFRSHLQNTHGTDTIYGARPDLNGAHQHAPFAFLWDAERTLFDGVLQPEWDQAKGTCAGQSGTRAATDALFNQIAFSGYRVQKRKVCVATTYGGARVNVGGHQTPYGDGACLAWIMRFLHDFGALPCGVWGQWDLTNPREDLAVAWGQAGSGGVPRELLGYCASFRVQAVHHCARSRNVADALFGRYGCAVASGQGFTTTRDEHGMCHPQGEWSHAMEVRGYFVDYRGKMCYVIQQSWQSAHSPNGPDQITLQDGTRVQLPEGAFGVDEDVFDSMVVSGGDTWAIGSVPGMAA